MTVSIPIPPRPDNSVPTRQNGPWNPYGPPIQIPVPNKSN